MLNAIDQLTQQKSNGKHSLTTEQQTRLATLFALYPDVVVDALPPGLRAVDHRIIIEQGKVPPHRAYNRLGLEQFTMLKKMLQELIDVGYIRPSSSPYGAPILFVRKKDGTWRMCVDYRDLNKITVRNSFPLPRVDDLFARLHGAKYFTKFDLASGYYQITVSDEDVPKTAFTTRYGSFEFLVMPLGLCNAPATFQDLMHRVFVEGLDEYLLVYLDDILVFSMDFDAHLTHLDFAFRKLREHKLYAKRSKCEFCMHTVEFLGHIVSDGGIRTAPGKVAAWLKAAVPTTVGEL